MSCRKTYLFGAMMVAALSGFALVARAENVLSVGCPSDGQSGPQPPPALAPKLPEVAGGLASRLSYYYGADNQRVLGPRGWHCVQLFGSEGDVLMVTPDALAVNGRGIADRPLHGPAIVLYVINGGTSGRFQVVDVATRVFPAALVQFVEDVRKEREELGETTPTWSISRDKLKRRSETEVEFTTPADSRGLGNAYVLDEGPLPIKGFVQLAPDPGAPGVALLSVRLPADLEDLARIIIATAEQQP
jgi:hypothetical protein